MHTLLHGKLKLEHHSTAKSKREVRSYQLLLLTNLSLRKCNYWLAPLQARSWIYLKMGNLSKSPDILIPKNEQLLPWNNSATSLHRLTRHLCCMPVTVMDFYFLIFLSRCSMKWNIKKHPSRSNGWIRRRFF